jgi:hypothetical protein
MSRVRERSSSPCCPTIPPRRSDENHDTSTLVLTEKTARARRPGLLLRRLLLRRPDYLVMSRDFILCYRADP